MTIGEKIQKHRKSLGLSQEELGQQLLVSRQTISLWEKDQTVPTIDNLIRLKDIFGTSVDEILDIETKETVSEIEPTETYQFEFAKTELNKIYRLQRKQIYKKTVLFISLCILLILFFIVSSAPELMIGLVFGMLLIGTINYIKGIRTYSKAWKNSVERICKSIYEYKIFENYISLSIYREGEKVRESKCYFTDIEKIQQFGEWMFFQFGGQSFIVRKSDLKENSAFYSYMYKNPAKATDNLLPNKWGTASTVLFVASIMSLPGALALVETFSHTNGLDIENMWLFFLLTPVSIASIVFGFILKSKGYKYKKNVITGIIITVLLCIYGSFTFIFK